LLWDDLQEKDIPHRTKLHEAIITMWKSWFISLKRWYVYDAYGARHLVTTSFV